MDSKQLQDLVLNLAKNVGSDVSEQLSDYVAEGRTDHMAKLVEKVAKYKGLAVTAESAEDMEMYSDMAAKVLLTLEHDLVQEKIIAEAKMAAVIKRAIQGAVAAFGVVLKEMAGLVVKGAIEGLKGGLGGIASK